MDGTGDDNAIRGNFIGTNRDGAAALGNGRAGVALSGVAASVSGACARRRQRHLRKPVRHRVLRRRATSSVGTPSVRTSRARRRFPMSATESLLGGDDHLVGGLDPGSRQPHLRQRRTRHRHSGRQLQHHPGQPHRHGRLGCAAARKLLQRNQHSVRRSRSRWTTGSAERPRRAANIIAFNGTGGVAATNSQGTSIRHNQIFRNRAASALRVSASTWTTTGSRPMTTATQTRARTAGSTSPSSAPSRSTPPPPASSAPTREPRTPPSGSTSTGARATCGRGTSSKARTISTRS